MVVGKKNQGYNNKRLGTPDKFINELGSQAYVRKQIGIDAEGITNYIRSIK